MPDFDKIAVIGLACRFPGADNYRRFAENLRKGADSITRMSRESLLARGVPAERLDDPRYVPARGVISDPDMFDNEFFGFSTSDVTMMDPQHRLFLMVAWHALEDAGYAAPRLRAQAGVFGACSRNSYAPVISGELKYILSGMGEHLSTRLSFKLNLRGPSMTVSTGCSSSLVAVIQAAQALLMGQCDIALAGGTSIAFPVEGYTFQKGSILSPDGFCRTFDARAAGMVPGDGAGMVVLKRLADAVRDGDMIRAVISGYGLNNDGNDKVGYSAPSVSGQACAIAMAHASAGVRPGDIGYVEAHGTATALGDAVEVAALRDVFDEAAEPGACALGAVKSSIGHLNAAAGVAGLIKTVLSVEHGVIFPSANMDTPNPALGLEDSAFHVPVTCEPWPGDGLRRAGVSAFGMGGTNVHVMVEQAPGRPAPPARDGYWPLLVSAKNPESLRAQAQDLAGALAAGASLPDAAFTMAEGREHFGCRLAVVADDPGQAAALLRAAEPGLSGEPARWDPAAQAAWEKCAAALPELVAAAAAWEAGADVRFSPLFSGGGFSRVPLPGYRFKTARYWDPQHPDLAAAPAAEGAAGTFRDTVASHVMAAWEMALGEAPDSPDADFYDAGGDSLSALELVTELQERLGVRLEVDDVFADPTPGELTRQVRTLLREPPQAR
jgi:acyl transferase domain-containing protein